ncbi:MAG: phosphate starvation-inducible protein PhoH [Verrucomicrobiales bacterium]|nr:phosphate starvation-inducible protein PhoH [Verrucomicrobiales bacterium]|tara:strand:- start:1473 stop:2429 length:957 start_codon:yes stop_codon:yes gene_type:complete
MTTTLHYDSARQAQHLFGNDTQNLHYLQEALNIQATARDGWIKLEGDEDSVARAKSVFTCLQKQLAEGQRLHKSEFIQAVDTVRDEGVDALQSLDNDRISTTPRKAVVTPKTVGQAQYIRAIKGNDVAIGTGPAGTGKTYLAMALAVNAFTRGNVSRIILTRPAVEAGEALGFLPGDLKEKLSPYLRPLHDALMDMMSAEEIQRHMERETIEIAPLAYMRGRTLNNAFVILDEAQNTTGEQMFMFLTRLGYNTKAVVTGDTTQIDLPPQKRSGLIEATSTLKQVDGVGIVELGKKDVIRHPLVRRIIKAYEERRPNPS